MPCSGRATAIALTLLSLLGVWRCASTPNPPQPSSHDVVAKSIATTSVIRAIAFDQSGALWAIRSVEGRCSLGVLDPKHGQTSAEEPLSFCPSSLQAHPGEVFGTDGNRSFSVSIPASAPLRFGTLAVWFSSDNYVSGRNEGSVWFRAGTRVSLPADLGQMRFLPGGDAIIGVQHSAAGERLVRIDPGTVQPTDLSDLFPSIDSFDLSPDGRELVFSALRSSGFDAAIGSTASLVNHWINPDPADEICVRWAPRGHKVSMVVRKAGASFIRTVHVPTSAELTVAFPGEEVEAQAWEPSGERIAVVSSSPTSSSRLSIVRYGGEEMTRVLEPERRLATETDVLPGQDAAVLLSPAKVRYGERYPVVVWTGVARPYRWSDPRAALFASTESGLVVTTLSPAEIKPEFWSAVTGLSWADVSRIFIVSYGSFPPRRLGGMLPGATIITARDPGAALSGIRIEKLDVSDPESFDAMAARLVIEKIARQKAVP